MNGRAVKFFDKRDDAREYARVYKKPKGSVGDTYKEVPTLCNGSNGKRWFVYI